MTLRPEQQSNMADIRSTIIKCLDASLNPQSSASVAEAEATLKQASALPEFCAELIKVVDDTQVDASVRLAGAVHFKNIIKASWAATNAESAAQMMLSDEVRAGVKQELVTVTLRSEGGVRPQLSAALATIADTDFPGGWQTLLPELVACLEGGDLARVHGVLDIMAAVFKCFRSSTIEESNDKLDYCQKLAARPVQQCAQAMEAAADAAGADKPQLARICKILELTNDVVFSLNVFGLSVLMAEQTPAWVEIWTKWLQWHSDALNEADPSTETAQSALKASICHNCLQFLEMQEEDIAPYLQVLVRIIWQLLIGCSSNAGHDNLAMACISFLTTLCRSTHHRLFEGDDAIRQICEGIIIPNVFFRDEDQENFDSDHVEYVRRDLEGSDSETRRRAACDLVRCLVDKFQAATTGVVTAYITALLTEYAAAPAAQWARKDCAMYLVMALAVKGRTAAYGATTVNELVDIGLFLDEQVAPELQTADVNERPVLKADCLRYIFLFRSKLPKAKTLKLLPAILRTLQSDSAVVHSYAAIVIERLLALRIDGVLLMQPADVEPVLQQLLTLLFGALGKPDSTENEYLMKCLMRVISFTGPQIAPVATQCLDWLTAKLLSVCRNPGFASFNHYLFESVAALIGAVKGDPAVLSALEDKLFPCFEIVLEQDISEFHPYVFQVFALLIATSKTVRSEYTQVWLQPFLRHTFWERKGNIPALTLLMQAYLRTCVSAFVDNNHIQNLLGIFQQLLSLPRHVKEAYALLASIYAYVPMSALQGFNATLFRLLFGVLTGPRKSDRNTHAFVVTVSKMLCWHGGAAVGAAMDAAQPGSAQQIFSMVFPNNLKLIKTVEDRRVVAIGLCRVLCEFEPLLSAGTQWQALLFQLLQFLADREAAEPEATAATAALQESFEEMMEYSNEFSQLSNAHLPPPPVKPDVPASGVAGFVGTSLSQLASQHTKTVPALLQSMPQQDKFMMFMQQAGVRVQ